MCTQTEHHCTQCGSVDTSTPISTCPAACIHKNILWRRRIQVYLEQCLHCLRSTTPRTPTSEIAITLADSATSPSMERVQDGDYINENHQPVVLRTAEEVAWRPVWHHGRGFLRPGMRWECFARGVRTSLALRRKSSCSRALKQRQCARGRAREAKEKRLKALWVQLEKRTAQMRCSD